jgi:phytoene dehydrogenase-like protein
MSGPARDAVVVGAGPNGLAAAIVLAHAGLSVRVIEAAHTVGGGARSAALTLPGFVHDVCSAVYPMGLASPLLRTLPLKEHGLAWVHPPTPFAHPLDGGVAATLERSVDATADRLGSDARPYRRLMGRLTRDAEKLFGDLLGPFRLPRHPLAAIRFGWPAIRSGRGLAEAYFQTQPARALIAGLAAHAVLPMEARPGAAIALMLGIAGHAVGWPVVAGGAQRLTDALARYLRSLGGEIETGRLVRTLDELPPARAVLLDLTPRQVLAVAGDHLPARYRRQLTRYRYGPGIFKVDWALSAPIPWAAPECRAAGTVHVGGTLDEISHSERAAFTGEYAERPFVLLAQPSLFDSSRAPAGRHTAWAYCHVPHGSTRDMTDRIEAQVERFAPGFRDVILARHTMTTADVERHNPNNVGGDITGGVTDFWQLFTRPAVRLNPYSTPARGLYLCSSSTPPGGGVHGMCGYFAARSVLRYLGVRH